MDPDQTHILWLDSWKNLDLMEHNQNLMEEQFHGYTILHQEIQQRKFLF